MCDSLLVSFSLATLVAALSLAKARLLLATLYLLFLPPLREGEGKQKGGIGCTGGQI